MQRRLARTGQRAITSFAELGNRTTGLPRLAGRPISSYLTVTIAVALPAVGRCDERSAHHSGSGHCAAVAAQRVAMPRRSGAGSPLRSAEK